MPYQLA